MVNISYFEATNVYQHKFIFEAPRITMPLTHTNAICLDFFHIDAT
jgi:hypothetical protein